MKVLAFASYPIQAAATRYRLGQFVGPLAERGINLTVRPFLDERLFERLYQREDISRNVIGLLKSALLRFKDLSSVGRADVVLVQREAMMFGPPLIEWLVTGVYSRPMVLDLDDATYVPYTSPTYGKVGQALKWFSKTDDLIRWATIVTCGNRSIADYVSSKGAAARVIPTVVDTDVFHPEKRNSAGGDLVLGWIGTHSTFPYLESLFPLLQGLAEEYHFRLKIVGAGRREIRIPGVEIDNLEWKLEREVKDFQSLDIGLYPIDASMYAGEWAAGKSGFKAIQYMAVGIPYVATPVGAIREIGEVGITHFCATTNCEWREALATLICEREKREKMGAAGRNHALEHFGLAAQADKLAEALRDAAGGISG